MKFDEEREYWIRTGRSPTIDLSTGSPVKGDPWVILGRLKKFKRKGAPLEWPVFRGILETMQNDLEHVQIKGPGVWVYDISRGCSNPYPVYLKSADDTSLTVSATTSAQLRYITLETPCRKCWRCLDNRRRLWRKRCAYEIHRAKRTWFVTLTVEPEWRFRFSLQSGSKDFADSYQPISKEVTKMFKRLRAKKHQFRYCMVSEPHKNGYPHIHLFVHEQSAPIVKRLLQAEWPYGHTNCKLVDKSDPRAVYYLTKYLSKNARTRIRASVHYGQQIIVDDLKGAVKNGKAVF